jgi:S1-C subfamily serine protease
MSISRLAENIRLDGGDRFILFYGNVNDEFCDDDLVFGNIDFMLWRYFREQGYQRIVFFQGAEKIYCFDQDSIRLCLPNQNSTKEDSRTSRRNPSTFKQGPLGKCWLLGGKTRRPASQASEVPQDTGGERTTTTSRPPTSPQSDIVQQQRSMSDLSALQILDFITHHEIDSVPTVVIFTLAEDISRRNFQGTSFREFQNRMMRWAQMTSEKRNRCVFIFQKTTLERVKEFIDRNELSVLENYLWSKEDQDHNVIHVGGPDKCELLNLFHHHRLRHNMNVDWLIVENIAEFLYKQNLSLKEWAIKFKKLKNLDKDTLLDWNKSGLIKSTDYLIDNIGAEKDMLDVSEIRDNLSQVYCQQDSIAQLIDTLEIWHAQIDKAKPLSLLFAGTSGVGKTYTIGLLAEALQPMGYDYCYFAMNEFSQEHTVSNLIGSPKGYVGSEEEPKLFEALKRSKKLVICFDEIEKAHEKILKALMQLMDKGFLSWSKGEGDFRDCILCFTSNAQMQKMISLKSKFEETSQSIEGPEFQNAIRDILVQAQVAPEVCGRINRFLVYNPLTPKSVIEITHQEVKKLAKRYGLEVMYTASEFLAETAEKTANSIYGARPIEQQVSSKLGKSILSIKKDSPSAKQIIIQKSSDGYQAIMVEENAKIPGREEMIIKAENLLKKNINNTSAQSTASIPKSKRLLHLSDLPASLPETLSVGQNGKSQMESKELENVLSSVGYIQVVEKDGEQSSGSGFVITPDGKLITCYHVVENAKSIQIRFDQNPEIWFPAVYFDGDERTDIAILQLKGKEFSYALLDDYGNKVSLGENVGLLGYPLGDELGSGVTFTTGVISSFRGDDGISLFQVDANAYPGSSGGPLFRKKDGKIIGILHGGLNRDVAVMINFAISIQEVYKRLISGC